MNLKKENNIISRKAKYKELKIVFQLILKLLPNIEK